ncbi:N-6 DNA methylase [Candidatus Parabeggiatoa sp. HSG14]|uniref:Eco57I restriction-modification methylase domain-containing protein n=1 Tax=Candidatus Parabeggiatoa sp. HSG14 TaxID=3055593 RepID=UPI0025A7AFC8|nr:Eco57I restriction-modification methylase domain-containing protein [Thiotrichales bacterium HSG14]
MSNPIKNLIERFEEQIDTYKQSNYNEIQTRSDFIIPFFMALGWDVNNEKGVAEPYRPVVHEDILKIDKAPYKRPDYSFRVGGMRKFFVEAKKPSINLKKNPKPAYQLRRYGWNAKLSLSIITNFAEFAVYDCRLKPEKDDDPSVGRVLYLKYTDYLESWEELVEWFSFEAVWQGKFDQYAAEKAITKGAIEVDTAFLNEMERWREKLAHHIFAKNPILTQRQLNFVVQQTIDRIVFLRICEDRGIEDYGRLLNLTNGKNSYKRLFELFIDADARYNSGLFHFKNEKGREQPDKLTPHLKIGDDVLQEIIISLYYPKSPYEFSVLPADILGQVYERFLGKIIRLTNEHEAIIEEKPEVKKAGGVYYTPSYIVDYIVKQTLTPLLKGKKIGSRSTVNRLKVLDPACGSGSFLLGAYQFLLDWHLQQYLQNPKKWAKGKTPRLYQAIGKTWKLTVEERKRILLNNIYGVDIDFQAVEVTKLSLLLKVLEDEQSVISQLSLLKERVLPDINNNIRCGNSLIGDEFYQEKQLDFENEETLYRINVFNWEAEFSFVLKAGGFDAIIGNPPYVRIQTLKEWIPLEVEFYKDQYIAARKGNYDIYVVFVEKALSLLNERGHLGFILPHKFFNAKYGESLRGLLAKGKHLTEIVHFGDQQVFANATTYTSLLFLSQSKQDTFRFIKVHNLSNWQTDYEAKKAIVAEKIASEKLTKSEWHFVVGTTAKKLFERLSHIKVKLENVTSRIYQGLKTGADKIYIVEEIERKPTQVKIYSREKKIEYWLDSDLLHPLVKGGDSKPFSLSRTNRLILFPYVLQDSHTDLISKATLTKNYALTWKYLLDNKESLQNRERFKMQGTKWYAYSRHQALDIISYPKIFTPDIAAQASFSLDETGEVFFTGGVSGGYGIIVLPEYLPKYVLGLLNSQLLEWFIRQTATQMRGGYYSYEARFIRHLPIRSINFNNPTDKANHDKIVKLVEQMLALNKKRDANNDPQTQTVLERRIKATDKQINQLVYTLYDLTAKEIEIVEKGD